MVQDSSKNGPVVFNLRSLNFWRVHALYEIGCKMLCIWAFKLLFCSQRLGGWSPAPAWTRVVLQYLLYDFDSLRKKKMIWLGQDFCPLVSFLSFFPSSGERRMDKRQRAVGTASWGSAAIERLSTWAGGGFSSRGHEESESLQWAGSIPSLALPEWNQEQRSFRPCQFLVWWWGGWGSEKREGDQSKGTPRYHLREPL